jgi:MFS family permease
VFALTSFIAGSLYSRLGAKPIVSAGALCLTVGSFLISLIDRDSGYGSLVPGMVVLGVGVGLFYSSITTAAVTALDPSRSSLAGGLVYMFQVAGGAVGLGLTTTVFITAYEDHLQAHAAGAVRDAFASGMQWAFRLVAALALAGFLVSVLFVGEKRKRAVA